MYVLFFKRMWVLLCLFIMYSCKAPCDCRCSSGNRIIVIAGVQAGTVSLWLQVFKREPYHCDCRCSSKNRIIVIAGVQAGTVSSRSCWVACATWNLTTLTGTPPKPSPSRHVLTWRRTRISSASSRCGLHWSAMARQHSQHLCANIMWVQKIVNWWASE